MTPSFLKSPTLRRAWSGRELWSRSRRNDFIEGWLGVNGRFGKREPKPSQNYEQHESQAMSMQDLYRWDKMLDSFRTFCRRER